MQHTQIAKASDFAVSANGNIVLANRFCLQSRLGSGGMGDVYLADDMALRRKVAVKTIKEELLHNQEVRKRIDRECMMHAAIGVHPNIVALYDKVILDGNIYLIMEFVEGELLSDFIARETEKETENDLELRIQIIVQILEGLARIHEQNIIHRDIKPSNIILQKHNGLVIAKLMDFGIARIESESQQVTQLTTVDAGGPGTPVYMAPERIDSKTYGSLSFATDLYSVGIILFQLLSDGPPFRGSLTETFVGHLTKPPDMGLIQFKISEELKVIIAKALQKKQIDRYGYTREFIEDLHAALHKTTLKNSVSTAAANLSSAKTLLTFTKPSLPIPKTDVGKSSGFVAKMQLVQFSSFPQKYVIVLAAVLLVGCMGYFLFRGIFSNRIATTQITEQPSVAKDQIRADGQNVLPESLGSQGDDLNGKQPEKNSASLSGQPSSENKEQVYNSTREGTASPEPVNNAPQISHSTKQNAGAESDNNSAVSTLERTISEKKEGNNPTNRELSASSGALKPSRQRPEKMMGNADPRTQSSLSHSPTQSVNNSNSNSGWIVNKKSDKQVE